MRFTYIKLKGYIGIYNGLGVDEIEIDLSKCTHKICTIVGINGCGKSTLLNALTIMPDSSSDFMNGVNAEKVIKLVDENNVYDIKITSASAKCGRGVSKASICKNGVELNPNGNIGSYKEIIFQEFELDSNYITLCKLSSDNRGIADKSPAERKKMVSFIVESLDTYNAIYKNLNKKSSIFKSYVNNLHTKIQNVGNEENIRGSLSALTQRKEAYTSQIDALKSKVIELQTLLNVYDANGSIQSQYEESSAKKAEKENIEAQAKNKLIAKCQKIGVQPDQESIIRFINKNLEVLDGYNKNIELYNSGKLTLVSQNENCTRTIESNSIKIASLSEGIDYTLRESEQKMRTKVEEELSILKSIGVSNPDDTTKEEMLSTFYIMEKILSYIDSLYYEITEDIIQAVFEYDPSTYATLTESISIQEKEVEALEDQIKEIDKDIETLSILKNRPEECTIDDCYFIKKAYNLYTSKYTSISVEEVSIQLHTKLDIEKNKLLSLNNELEKMSIVFQKASILNAIRNTIDTDKHILVKSTITKRLVDEYEERIKCLRSFNDFRDAGVLVDQCNVITRYKDDIAILRRFQSQLEKQSNSEEMVRQFEEENKKLQEEQGKIQAELIEYNRKLDSFNELSKVVNTKLELAREANELYKEWEVCKKDLDTAAAEFEEVLQKSKRSITTLESISQCNLEIANLQEQLAPIETQISTENGKLLMLESYKEEYNLYSEKYNLVDTLKKYSSPTSGIQTLFMSMYMSKTLDLANKVLSMIFGGQYQLLDYVINATEFKIPFIGQGLRVDDISSGSASQICMMGMVLNLVLKYQASNKYNIASLDEIDGGLDSRNRLSYVNILYKLIDILEIDQLFVISHSLELESANVDIIKLKQYQDYGEASGYEGNVVYDFNQVQH